MNLYGNPNKAKKLGENAQERIHLHFNISKTIYETKLMLEDLIKK